MRRLGALIVLIMMLTVLIPPVQGDGVAIINETLHAVTRENRQLAVVDVHDNYEILHLFLSIVSLDPGRNITIVVPLPTEPEPLQVDNTTDMRFLAKHELDKVGYTLHRERRAVDNLWKGYLFGLGSASMGMAFPFGIMGMYMMVGGMGSGSGAMEYHFQTGDTIEVYNFTSTRQLKNFEIENNITLPDEVKDALDRYGNYYAMVIKAKTRAPIPLEKYEILEEKCPRSMELLRDYVKKHPTANIKLIPGWSLISIEDGDELVDTINKEADGNHTLMRYFTNTLLAIYGGARGAMVGMEGIEITVKLPLWNHRAYFPLGTSPSWGSSGWIRIYFKLPEDMEMHPNYGDYRFVYHNHSYYYYWNYDGKLPEHDLYGTVTGAGAGVWIEKERQEIIVNYLAPIAGWLGFFLGVSTLLIFWIAILLLSFYWETHGEILKDGRKMERIVHLSLLTFPLALLITFAGGVALVYTFASQKSAKYGIGRDIGKSPTLAMTIIIGFAVLLSMSLISIYLLFYNPSMEVTSSDITTGVIFYLGIILPIFAGVILATYISERKGKTRKNK